MGDNQTGSGGWEGEKEGNRFMCAQRERHTDKQTDKETHTHKERKQDIPFKGSPLVIQFLCIDHVF